MKFVSILTFLSVMLTVAFLTMAFAEGPGAGTGDLVITVEGFENSEGVARIALVNSKENFSEETPFKGYECKIVHNRAIKTLSLPYGEYAVKVFHDENRNGELDKRLFGIPAEAYGFSNDARGTMGPPEYEKAAFKLEVPKKEITITIK